MKIGLLIATALAAASIHSGGRAGPPERTATFAGLKIVETSAAEVEAALKRNGAREASERLYQSAPIEKESPTGDPKIDALRQGFTDIMNRMIATDYLKSEFDIRLRAPIHELGEGEVLIQPCPADGSIEMIWVDYPRSVTTKSDFALVTRRLSDEIGRGPDDTEASYRGTIRARWNFQDGTWVQARYADESARKSTGDAVAAVTVTYAGPPAARKCAQDFRSVN